MSVHCPLLTLIFVLENVSSGVYFKLYELKLLSDDYYTPHVTQITIYTLLNNQTDCLVQWKSCPLLFNFIIF